MCDVRGAGHYQGLVNEMTAEPRQFEKIRGSRFVAREFTKESASSRHA